MAKIVSIADRLESSIRPRTSCTNRESSTSDSRSGSKVRRLIPKGGFRYPDLSQCEIMFPPPSEDQEEIIRNWVRPDNSEPLTPEEVPEFSEE